MTIPKPIIPGTVIRFVGTSIPRVQPSASDTVAIPMVSDWGPVGVDPPGTDGRQGGPQEVTSFAEYTSLFGDSDTPGRVAAAGCFSGQGIAGAPGAGGVICYRMAGTSKAKSTLTLHDSTGPAVDLDARYYGTRGDAYTVTIEADPVSTGHDRMRIFYQGVVQESYSYPTTSGVVSLVASVNQRSKLVTATNNQATPAKLTAITQQPLAGGDDGTPVTASDHLDALAALELQPFGILSPFDLTDDSILASYVSWIQSQEDANRPIRLVVGGDVDETIDDALTRSASIGNPHVINVGCGTWHDDLLDKDLSTSQLAPRIAGIVAARGEEQSITYCLLGGIHAVGNTGPAVDSIQSGIVGGVVVFMQASSPEADIRIAKGVTTFTSQTDAARPYDVFSDERLVGIMDGYIRDMKTWGDDVVIGSLPVNDDTRALVRGHARVMQDDLLTRGLILPGDDITVPKPFVIVEDPKDPALLDAIPYTFGWQFAYTTNAILGEGQIR